MFALLIPLIVVSPFALAAAPPLPRFTPVIDSPVDGSVNVLDPAVGVVLQGHAVTTNMDPTKLYCKWYVDDVLRVDKQPVTSSGRCDATLPAGTLTPAGHVFRFVLGSDNLALVVSTSVTASFVNSPTITAHRNKTCGGMDGIFEIEGRVTGSEADVVYLSLTAEDDAGPVEFTTGRATTTTLTKTVAVSCEPILGKILCYSNFDFTPTLADPSAHTGPIRWRIDAEDHVDYNKDGTADLTLAVDYESTRIQDLRVMVPPPIQYQEVLDGVPGAITDQAPWAYDAAHPTYTFLATFPSSPGPDPFWETAEFTATGTCVDGGESTSTPNCVRSETTDGSGLATVTYLCEQAVTDLCGDGSGGYTPWTLALEATDEDGATCTATDTFELDMYADSGMADFDRDGTTVTLDGDCDDDDPTAFPGNPDADICDDEVDNDCNGTINDVMLDDYDAVARNETYDAAWVSSGTTSDGDVAPDFTFAGSISDSDDVDWYRFQVGNDSPDDNVTLRIEVDLRDACAAGAAGDFTVTVLMAQDGKLSGAPDSAYNLASDGEPAAPPTGTSVSTLDCSTADQSLAFVGATGQEHEIFWWVGIEYASAAWEYAVCADAPAASTPAEMYSIKVRD